MEDIDTSTHNTSEESAWFDLLKGTEHEQTLTDIAFDRRKIDRSKIDLKNFEVENDHWIIKMIKRIGGRYYTISTYLMLVVFGLTYKYFLEEPLYNMIYSVDYHQVTNWDVNTIKSSQIASVVQRVINGQGRTWLVCNFEEQSLLDDTLVKLIKSKAQKSDKIVQTDCNAAIAQHGFNWPKDADVIIINNHKARPFTFKQLYADRSDPQLDKAVHSQLNLLKTPKLFYKNLKKCPHTLVGYSDSFDVFMSWNKQLRHHDYNEQKIFWMAMSHPVLDLRKLKRLLSPQEPSKYYFFILKLDFRDKGKDLISIKYFQSDDYRNMQNYLVSGQALTEASEEIKKAILDS